MTDEKLKEMAHRLAVEIDGFKGLSLTLWRAYLETQIFQALSTVRDETISGVQPGK